MYEYHKIETLYQRDMEGSKKLMPGVYRDETVESLKDIKWQFTEKIDGTNIGIHWDGHKVHIQGRTERAQIPAFLLDRLNELFGGDENEQLFEQTFGETEVVLFGEGYGAKIQKGGSYIPNGVDFILFDVYITNGDLYLRRDDVEDIAKTFGIDVVPIVLEGTLDDAVEFVKGHPKSTIGTADMEGVVGRPRVEVKDRRGKRIIVKIKYNDFK